MSTALLTAPPLAATPPFENNTIRCKAEEQGPHKRLVSAREYLWMAENGLFEGQRVELINGEIINMGPISEPHAQCVDKITKKLNRTLDEALITRNQNPFNAGNLGRPQPDIAVVHPDALNITESPSEALLIIEVSRTTLHYDRTTKLSLYASIGIQDYWIVNLVENQVEVYRQPFERASAEFGHDYSVRQIYQRGQGIALLEVPGVAIDVDAMLL